MPKAHKNPSVVFTDDFKNVFIIKPMLATLNQWQNSCLHPAVHHDLLIKLNAWASLKHNAGNDACGTYYPSETVISEGSECTWNYKAMTEGFNSCCWVKSTNVCLQGLSFYKEWCSTISLTFIHGPEGNTWHTGTKSIVKTLFLCCKAIKSDGKAIMQFQQKDWDWHMLPDNISIFLQFLKQHSGSTDLYIYRYLTIRPDQLPFTSDYLL